MKYLRVALLTGFTFFSSITATAERETNVFIASDEYPETSVCGFVREPMAFWSWSRMAGRSSPNAGAQHPNAERISHETRDGRLLKGFRLASLTGDANPPAVVVAQGNAMLAEHLLGDLQSLARAGLDVWVFDYRGYGASEGKARLQPIVGDYLELHQRVSEANGEPPHLYGISFGGIVLMNVIGQGAAYQRGVVDGSPARVDSFGCPTRFNPAGHFPTQDANILVISGNQDDVVPLRQTQELIELANKYGGAGVVKEEFNHPFMDGPEIRRERMELIRDFLVTGDLPSG